MGSDRPILENGAQHTLGVFRVAEDALQTALEAKRALEAIQVEGNDREVWEEAMYELGYAANAAEDAVRIGRRLPELLTV